MKTLLRVTAVTLLVLSGGSMMLVGPPTALSAQAQPQQQEEFVPIDQLPPQEQLPAAPLLVGAYAFVLLMLFGYLLIVSRRLNVIQQEVDRLDKELKHTNRH